MRVCVGRGAFGGMGRAESGRVAPSGGMGAKEEAAEGMGAGMASFRRMLVPNEALTPASLVTSSHCYQHFYH